MADNSRIVNLKMIDPFKHHQANIRYRKRNRQKKTFSEAGQVGQQDPKR
jgi:hypothetical protein